MGFSHSDQSLRAYICMGETVFEVSCFYLVCTVGCIVLSIPTKQTPLSVRKSGSSILAEMRAYLLTATYILSA